MQTPMQILTVSFVECFIQRFKNTNVIDRITKTLTEGTNLKTVYECDNVCDLKGHLIISNHISPMDWADIKRHIPCGVVTYLGDSSLSIDENYSQRGVIPYNFMDVDSGNKVKNKILDVTSKGHNVLLFPEGKINYCDNARHFHKGGIKHAYINNIPILAVRIDFIDPDGNVVTKEHNDWIDILVFIGNIPVEPSIIKIKTLSKFKPSDYDSFDSFFNDILSFY